MNATPYTFDDADEVNDASDPWENEESASDPPPKPTGESFAAIVKRWSAEGPLVRRSIGIPSLDNACRGGLPFPWRVVLIGAPSAGKTAILMHMARHLATAHSDVFVGVLAVDEEGDDLAVRHAQMVGFSVDDCETRDPIVLERIRVELESLRACVYSADFTIEQAAEDTALRAMTLGCRPALVLDSIQTVTSDASHLADSERGVVNANLKAVRTMATRHRMLVIATSEANRAAYRREDASETSNDMAAGKESGAIEFMAQTQLMVRTPKGYANHMNVKVPKNRRGARSDFEFFLRLDRERHSITECADPTTGDAEHSAIKNAEQQTTKNVAGVRADARALAKVVRETPDMGENALRGALRAKGHRWGVERLNGARTLLKGGVDGVRLVDGGDAKACHWRLVPTTQEASHD